MNNIINRVWKQGSMVNIDDLRGMTFQAEDAGHTFQIRGIDGDGNPIALSGTPAGIMLRSDHQDVTLDCSVSDGIVSATLPANAYVVPGKFGITVYLTSGGQTMAIYAAIGSVSRTSSGTVAPPAGSNVVDLVNAIQDAIALIPSSDTNLKAAMAPTYSTSAVYAVGSYAWYNGQLYRCTTAITSGETWTSGHWTLADMGTDVKELRNAIGFRDAANKDIFYFGENWTGTYHSLYVRKTENNTFYLDGKHTGSYDYRIISYDSDVSVVTSQASLDKTKFTINLIKGQKYKIRYEKISGNAMTDTNSMFWLYGINDQDAVFSQGVGVNPKELSENAFIEKPFVASATKYALVLYERSINYYGTYRICILHDIIDDSATENDTDRTLSAAKIYALNDDLDYEVFQRYPTRNLWNDETAQKSGGTGVSVTQDESDYTLVITTAGENKGALYKVPVEIDSDQWGENIVLSALLKSSDLDGNPVLRFNCADSNASFIYGSTAYSVSMSVGTRKSVVMPIAENTKYIFFGLYSSTRDNPLDSEWVVSDIQVEYGNAATEYIKAGGSIENLNSRINVLENKEDDSIDQYVDDIPVNHRIVANGFFRDCYNPYKNGGTMQLKGQLHCHHTDNTGAELSTMEQIYNNYKTLYDFMVLTDYASYADYDDYDTLVELNEETEDGYDLIQLTKGYEMKVSEGGSTKRYHMIVYNKSIIESVPGGTSPMDAIKTFIKKNAVIDFPHPSLGDHEPEDMDVIAGSCRFIEVRNGGTSYEDFWDRLLTNGNFIFGLGVTDAHGTGSSIINTAFVKVFAEEKTREAIFRSILDGNFYASTGATIDAVTVDETSISVTTSDENAAISFIGAEGTVLKTVESTSASYTFDGSEKYVRAKVESDSGIAWTQPLMVKNTIGR